MIWGLCKCGKWGWASLYFNEQKHFLKCTCGKTMFTHYTGHPSDAGYSAAQEITPTLTDSESSPNG